MGKQLANTESKKSEEIIGVGKEKPISNKSLLDFREELNKDILKIKQEAEDLKKEFDKLEKRQNRANSFIMAVAGVIVISFLLASISIFLDYWKYNEERYEKFIDKTEE